MTPTKRRWSDKTVQKWADRWAAKLGLAEVPRIITDPAEFARLTGYKRASRYLGVSGWDYTFVKTEGCTGVAIRDTVIHELLHLRHPIWPHWRVSDLASDLAHGRSGRHATEARTESDYLVRTGYLPKDWESWST